MILQNRQLNHAEDGFHSALGVSKDIAILCRERIFFSHFTSSLQAFEIFEDREDAPKELTTVTGDLQRTLQMITDPLEYEVTLLYFMSYHSMAQKAFAIWKFQNDPSNSVEQKLKLELVKIMSKIKDMKDQEDKEEEQDKKSDDGDVINLDTVQNRIELVKKSRYSFPKYMQLLGHPLKQDFGDVDKMINGLFD